jgi:hypothetical protein
MSWPSTVTTQHLDSDTDSVLLARTEILATALAVNEIVTGRGTASGVASLDSNGRIPPAQLPGTFSTANTDIVLEPGSNRVAVQSILNLLPQSTAQIAAIALPAAGDVVYASDGDAGDPCLAVYNGTAWLRVSLGAAVSAT